MKNFYVWLQEQKIELSDIQEKAAISYLKKILKFNNEVGKTFLHRIVDRFLSTHGNSFCLVQPKKTKKIK